MKQDTELEYLRYFYSTADFGPADGDVRLGIDERFKRETGLSLPKGYDSEDEE